MRISALHELETAVILAQQSWTGLDWTDDEESISSVAASLNKLACRRYGDDSDRRIALGRFVGGFGGITMPILSTWIQNNGSPESRDHTRDRERLARTIDELCDKAEISADELTTLAELAQSCADEERTYVEEQAAHAAAYGNDALKCAHEGLWSDAVDALKCAAVCELTFGDHPTWGKPLQLARRVAAAIKEIRDALDASTAVNVDGQEILDYSILLLAVTESIDHTSTVKGLTVDVPPLAKRLLERNASLVSELVAIACAGGPGAITLM